MIFGQRIVLLTFVAICVASLAACGPAPAQTARHGYGLCVRGVTRTSDGILRVCAPINAATIAEVERLITDQDREVILTSDGGASYDGMALAKVFNDRGLTVRARGFCVSACSTYVLLTAKRVIVEPYTIVAFHHTGAFAADLIAERFALPQSSPLRQLSRDERAFFTSAGLDAGLLDRLAMAVEPTCIAEATAPDGERTGVLRYRWSLFMPTEAEAAELFRGRLTGYWPKSRQEAETIGRPTLGRPDFTIRYGWPVTGSSDPSGVAAAMPDC